MGDIQWVRKLPGVFDTVDGVVAFEQDYNTASIPAVNQLYIGPRMATNAWHLYSINIAGAVPQQVWHSYLTTSGAQNLQGIDSIGFSTTVIIASSYYESTNRRHALVQVSKTTGLY